jgi:DHA1 family multidrug resistance protein-like MFS transporter
MNCLQAFIPDINFLFPVRIVLGLFYGLVFPLLFSVIAFETPMNRKSGIMGIASSFQTLGNFIGPLAAGYLLSLLHFKGSFLFSGFLFILMGTMVLTIVLRRQKSD